MFNLEWSTFENTNTRTFQQIFEFRYRMNIFENDLHVLVHLEKTNRMMYNNCVSNCVF